MDDEESVTQSEKELEAEGVPKSEKELEEEGVTKSEKEIKEAPERPFTPNYAVWILSFMSVIAVFYFIVFYAGAGLFYLLSRKVDLKRKDIVPYSETLERERQERLKTMESAPSLTETPEDTKS